MTTPSTGAQRSAILCVDWGASGVRERTTATELTETSAFVLTESLPPVEAEVDLELRFARRPPIALRGRVTQVRLSLAPGSPTGFAVSFVADPPALRRIAALVREPRPARKATSRALRVLHVDRNRLLRDMFAYAVTRYFGTRGLGVDLVQAEGLATAREPLEAGALDAVLVDHDTDDATGDEVVRYARSHVGDGCWIVGIGAEGVHGREDMLAAGADIYLRKPLVLRDLLFSMELLFQEDDDGLGRGAA